MYVCTYVYFCMYICIFLYVCIYIYVCLVHSTSSLFLLYRLFLDMTQEYQYKEIPFNPLSSSPCDLQLNTSPASMSMHSTSSQDNSSADASGAYEEMMEDDDDKKRREIEEEMYRYMCVLHEIVTVESVLEQYVLRELRHLQEFLCHKYPPIISYIRAPFDEVTIFIIITFIAIVSFFISLFHFVF